NRKKPTRMAPDTTTPATTTKGSPQPGVILAWSSVLRRPRAAASSSIPATNAKTAVAVASIGHHSPATDRAAGPFGLTTDVFPVHPPAVRTAATAGSVRATGANGPPRHRSRPVDTPLELPFPGGLETVSLRVQVQRGHGTGGFSQRQRQDRRQGGRDGRNQRRPHVRHSVQRGRRVPDEAA